LIPGDKAEPANKFQVGSSAFAHNQKRNRTGPKNGPMRVGKYLLFQMAAGLFIGA
jgi:hypothetical protein